MSLALSCSNEDLFEAVQLANTEEVRRLLAEGAADVNGRDDREFTPLIWTPVSGSVEIAELLIAKGAAVNARNQIGQTTLHGAAYLSRRGITQLLIQNGADVNVKTKAGWTPLLKAMERFVNPETKHQVSQSDVEAMVSIVKMLTASGADVNAKNASGYTPLIVAAAIGQKVLIELMLAKNADIHAKTSQGVTPLYAAATISKHLEIAKLLLSSGAEVNFRTKSGYTSLSMASQNGNKDIVELLILNNAEINTEDIYGMTPLLQALRSAHVYTPSYQTRLNPENQRVTQGFLQNLKGEWREIAMLLITHGANTNAISKNNNSPLDIAVNLNSIDLVEALIDHGADLNYAGNGETALHAAIVEKHRDVAELLILKGANVNALNISNRTPLHFLATFIDDQKLAQLMIEHGANVNANDKNGRTALFFATKKHNDRVAKIIWDYGGK